MRMRTFLCSKEPCNLLLGERVKRRGGGSWVVAERLVAFTILVLSNPLTNEKIMVGGGRLRWGQWYLVELQPLEKKRESDRQAYKRRKMRIAA